MLVCMLVYTYLHVGLHVLLHVGLHVLMHVGLHVLMHVGLHVLMHVGLHAHVNYMQVLKNVISSELHTHAVDSVQKTTHSQANHDHPILPQTRGGLNQPTTHENFPVKIPENLKIIPTFHQKVSSSK